MPPTLDHQVDTLLAHVTYRILTRDNISYALENPQTFDPQRLRIVLDGMVGPAVEVTVVTGCLYKLEGETAVPCADS